MNQTSAVPGPRRTCLRSLRSTGAGRSSSPERTGSTSATSLFDNVIDPAAADARERFEAVARSVRDVLSQRWVLTEETYEQRNPKRVYYLSMEFLIGRSLANNVTNLLLDPIVAADRQAARRRLARSWSSRSPMPAWATAASGGWRRASSTRWRRCSCRRWATGCATSTASSGSRSRTAGSSEQPGQLAAPAGSVGSRAPARARRGQARTARSSCAAERLRAIPGRPSSLIGIPYDRPVVGYGGKTINTLRLWAAAAPDYFDFQAFSSGDFVGALAETLAAESLTRVLYPDDSTSMGQGLRFVQEYFLVACSLADLVRRFRRGNSDWSALPEKVAIQLNDTHPDPGGPRADAHPARRGAPGLGRGLGPHAANARLHQPHAAARSAGEVAGRLVRADAAAPSRDHLRDQPAPAGRCPRPLSRRRGARRAREPDRGRRRAQDPHGQPRDRRLAQHQRRRRDPLRAAAHDDGQGPRRDVPRALQQQDQRRHAAALAAAGQPGARRARSPRRSATSWITDLVAAARACSRSPTTPAFATRSCGPSAQAKVAVRRLAQGELRAERRSGHDLRLPGQAHPRVQAAAAQRAAHRRALQPAAREPGAGRCRRGRSSSPARRRRPTGSPSSSSSSSTTSPARSTATRRLPGGSRSSSCPNTASRWPSG